MFDHHRRHHHCISLIFVSRERIHAYVCTFDGWTPLFFFLSFGHIKLLEFFFFLFSDGFTPHAPYCIFYFSFLKIKQIPGHNRHCDLITAGVWSDGLGAEKGTNMESFSFRGLLLFIISTRFEQNV